MFEALFLNPLPASAVKGKSKKANSSHSIKSKRLKGWQACVKRNGGDLKAASKEWKSRSSGAKSKRGAGSAAKNRSRSRLSGLAARRAASSSSRAKGGVPMAARRKRRRNQIPPEAKWIAKWRAGMTRAGRKPKASAPKFRKISSVTRQGKKNWRKKYVKGVGKSLRRHTAGKKKGGPARKYARKVRAGIRRSSVLSALAANPATADLWTGRFYRSTGYRPYKKRTKTGRVSKRKRGPRPGTAKWRRAVAKGVKRKGRSAYARAVTKPGLPQKYQDRMLEVMLKGLKRDIAANPVKRRRKTRGKRRRSSMRSRMPVLRANELRRLALAVKPRRRRKKKGRRRTYRRRRNPVAASLQAMYSRSALENAAYITGGVAVGAVVPNVVTKYIFKGEDKPQWVETLIGVGGSILAGLGVAMGTKDDTKGALVAAGGLAGALGMLIAQQLNKSLGFAGFGQSAEDALKAAVETEMERAGLTGMGQFLLPSEAEGLPAPGAAGMGQFLTEPELQTDVAQTEGFGQGTATADMLDDGSAAFQGIDGSVF